MNRIELEGWIRRELAARADPAFRESLAKFFREPVEAYGVRTPETRAVARTAYRECKSWAKIERERLAEHLWKSGRLEECGVATAIYSRFAREFGESEFTLFERWIDRYVHNWGNCDGVASVLLTACIENDPALISALPAWTESANRWKRRAAIVALLREAKQGRHTTAILNIAGRLIGDSDDMVQKGLGWVLKETYPKKPSEVVRFLRKHASTAPRLVLRLAAEKMTSADREAVLA